MNPHDLVPGALTLYDAGCDADRGYDAYTSIVVAVGDSNVGRGLESQRFMFVTIQHFPSHMKNWIAWRNGDYVISEEELCE